MKEKDTWSNHISNMVTFYTQPYPIFPFQPCVSCWYTASQNASFPTILHCITFSFSISHSIFLQKQKITHSKYSSYAPVFTDVIKWFCKMLPNTQISIYSHHYTMYYLFFYFLPSGHFYTLSWCHKISHSLSVIVFSKNSVAFSILF